MRMRIIGRVRALQISLAAMAIMFSGVAARGGSNSVQASNKADEFCGFYDQGDNLEGGGYIGGTVAQIAIMGDTGIGSGVRWYLQCQDADGVGVRVYWVGETLDVGDDPYGIMSGYPTSTGIELDFSSTFSDDVTPGWGSWPSGTFLYVMDQDWGTTDYPLTPTNYVQTHSIGVWEGYEERNGYGATF